MPCHVTHYCMRLAATGPARHSALCTVQYANTGEEKGVSALETLLRVCVCDEFTSKASCRRPRAVLWSIV